MEALIVVMVLVGAASVLVSPVLAFIALLRVGALRRELEGLRAELAGLRGRVDGAARRGALPEETALRATPPPVPRAVPVAPAGGPPPFAPPPIAPPIPAVAPPSTAAAA